MTLIVGDEPVLSRPPEEATRAGLTSTVAAVISTYRSDSPDMVLDHSLWLSCARTVAEVTGADENQVFGESKQSLLRRLLGHDRAPELGTLDDYAHILSSDPDPPEWGSLYWKRNGQLVAAAVAEYFYRSGGPTPYDDSYTTRMFVAPRLVDELVCRMKQRVQEVGGRLDRVVRMGSEAHPIE